MLGCIRRLLFLPLIAKALGDCLTGHAIAGSEFAIVNSNWGASYYKNNWDEFYLMLEREIQIWPKVWQCRLYPSLRQNENLHTTCHIGQLPEKKLNFLHHHNGLQVWKMKIFQLLWDNLGIKAFPYISCSHATIKLFFFQLEADAIRKIHWFTDLFKVWKCDLLRVNFHFVAVCNSAVMEFWPFPLEQIMKLFLKLLFKIELPDNLSVVLTALDPMPSWRKVVLSLNNQRFQLSDIHILNF